MNEDPSEELIRIAREHLGEGRLADACDVLESVPAEGANGVLATEWLAGIYLWNGQEVRARAAISQRVPGSLTDGALLTKMVQAFLLEDMPTHAAEFLPSQAQAMKDPERCLALACYHASVGNDYYAIGWLLSFSLEEISPERWLLDPNFQKLWQHLASGAAPAELLRGLSLLDDAAGFGSISSRVDRPIELGIFNRRDISPKYCPIFELDIPRGIARINPDSCLRHPVLFAEFLAWSSSLMETNRSLIRQVVGRARGRSTYLTQAKEFALAGRYHTARAVVLKAVAKSPHALEDALADPAFLPLEGSIRDLVHCCNARPESAEELLAVEKLCEAAEIGRAFEILDRLNAATGGTTLLTLKRSGLHYYDRSYEQALDLARVVIEQWPDDPVAWAIAANSLRCMARLEDSADLLLSAPPNIIFLPKVRELADFLKGFGHHLPLFESQDWLRPLTEEIAAGEPDMFCAVGVLAVESLQPAKYYLGSFPSLAAAIHNCRQFLRQILQGIHTEGMDQNELLAWAERFSLSALTIPSSTFCPRADIREESAKMAAAPSNQANQTKP